MIQKYRLGIDLGTSSIGVAAFSLTDENEIKDLIYLDSYIFGEPTIQGKNQIFTANTQRRSARLIRRQIERKAARLRKMGYIAQSIGITKEETSKIPSEKIHELRAKAISQEVTLAEFIKVLFHLAKNRGYSGDLDLADEESEEKSKSKKSTPIKDAIEKIHEESKNSTVGCLIYQAKQNAAKGEPWRKLNGTGTYAFRDDIKQEFEKLWQEQSKYYPELNGNYKILSPKMFLDHEGKKEITIKEAFYSAIFYQRPIRWDKDTIGNCQIYPDRKRAATMQMAFQNYRLLTSLSNLRYKEFDSSTKGKRPLELPQIVKLYNLYKDNVNLYNSLGIITFKQIYKDLSLNDEQGRFTIDRGRTGSGIKGNKTLKVFSELNLLDDWNKLEGLSQEIALEYLANNTKYSDIIDVYNSNPDKIILSVKDAVSYYNDIAKPKHFEEASKFIKLLCERNIFKKDKFVLEKNRASYSCQGLHDLIENCLLLGGDEHTYLMTEREKHGHTGLRDFEDMQVGSPVIDKAIREFHRVISFVVKKFGNPEEITVELSRDLKNSLEQRKLLESDMEEQGKKRQKAIAELQKHHIPLTQSNIEKYLLWEQQKHECPYSGKPINIKNFCGNEVQIDHIIPRAWGGPNTFDNKILVYSKENSSKGDNTPHTWDPKNVNWAVTFKKDDLKDKSKKYSLDNFNFSGTWVALEKYIKTLIDSAQSIKARKTPSGKWYIPKERNSIYKKIENIITLKTEQDMNNEFAARQEQENAWISKIVLGWCEDICDKVVPGFGPLTHYLRNSLHFEDILPLIRLAENKPLLDRDNKVIDSKLWYELFVSQDTKFLEKEHKTEEWCKIYTRPVREFNYKNAKILKEDFEKYLNEQSDKPNNDEDYQKLFKKFLRDKRKVFSFYKRCDHRHHAVDAAIIGLCTQSLVQRASTHNAKYGGLTEIEDESTGEVKVAGFYIDNMELYSKIKEQTHKYLSNYIVWHKPDRFPSGALFDQTAYNVIEKDGKKYFVRRGTFDKFIESNADKTIKKLDKLLYGNSIKREVIRQFQERINQGLSVKDALLGKPKDNKDGIYFHGNKVKQVKYMYPIGVGLRKFNKDADKEIITLDKSGKKYYKVYQNAGYACMIFDAKTGKRTDIIPMWKYNESLSKQEGKICIFAQDILFSEKDNQFYKVKSFKERDGLVLHLVTESNEKETYAANLKGYTLVKSRADLAKIKKEKLKQE